MNNIVTANRYDPPAESSPSRPNYSATLPRQDGVIFLRDILAAVARRWRMAAVAAAVMAAAVVVGGLMIEPLYRSTATIMLDTRHEEVDNVPAVLSGLPSDSNVVDSEVQVLTSPALAHRIIAKLHLDRDPEFNAQLRPKNIFQNAIGWVKGAFHQAMLALHLAQADTLDSHERTGEAVTEAFEKNLDVERIGLTYVITVSFWSEDPSKAVRIVNAVAEAYLTQQQEMKTRAAKAAAAMLQPRVQQLGAQMRKADQAVADFKARHGLLNIVGANLTEQEMSALDTQLAVAKADEANEEGKYAAALSQSRKGGLDAVGADATSDTMAQLRAQQAEVLRQQADMEARYGDKHPALIRIRQQAADLNKAIGAETNRILSNLKANAAAAAQRTASIEASLSKDRTVLALNNSAGVQLADLQRNADSVRTLYQGLLDRLKQISAQEGMQDADAQIVAHGTYPLNPAYPPWMLIEAAAALLALLAASGVIVFREMRDRGLKSPEDAEIEFGLPVLATIPSVRNERPAIYAAMKPLSSYAEAFRNLRAALSLARPGGAASQVVAMMSAVPGEGKTTCTLALARLAALSGARVAVVDADLHHRSVSAQLRTVVEYGFLEALSGRRRLEDCLYRDPESKVMILPCANTALDHEDALFEYDVGRLFEELRRKFDIVLIDTAPLLPLAEPRLIARHADSVVVIARWNRTSRLAIADALKLVRSMDVPIVGLALTCVDLNRLARFGYSGSSYRNYRKAYAGYYIE